MLFKEVVGLKNTKEHLAQTVDQNRISHAQLFLASEGAGGLPMALAYATYVLCDHKTGLDACGKCPSCLKVGNLIHPDVHFVYPVATSKTVSKSPTSDDYLEQWRELLLKNPYADLQDWYGAMQIENKQGNIGTDESESIMKKLSLKSFEGGYKIMIIWQAHFMNESASNKLLKLIEEPPPQTLFILVTGQTERILPTILSRTQMVKIPILTAEEILASLKEKYPDGSSMDQLAHLVQGNYNRALQLIEQGDAHHEYLESFKTFMRFCYVRDYLKLQEWVDQMAGIGREGLKDFFGYCLRMIRENYIKTVADEQLNYMTEEESSFAANFHKFIHKGNVALLVKDFSLAHAHIAQNGHAKIILLDLCIQVSKFLKSKEKVNA